MQQCSAMLRMVDLQGQYEKIKSEVDGAICEVLCGSAFINGPQVKAFEGHLSDYLGVRHVIGCGNGTDALQIALMALGLKAGDEVIVPAFTYVATAEVIGLLGLTPVLVDVDYGTFNVGVEHIRRAVTPRTKAIVPVHLFGQSCDMGPILDLAGEYGLWVVEDNAQAIGAAYRFRKDCYRYFPEEETTGGMVFRQGSVRKTGTMGHIGCTSFFPSKNLGCYGDGGALMTDDDELAEKIRMIANHGQREKYRHQVLGCNSRLDTIQAAVLDVKLKYLDEYNSARYEAARYYTERLRELDPQEKYYITPQERDYSTHVYHQYTLKIRGGAGGSDKDAMNEPEGEGLPGKDSGAEDGRPEAQVRPGEGGEKDKGRERETNTGTVPDKEKAPDRNMAYWEGSCVPVREMRGVQDAYGKERRLRDRLQEYLRQGGIPSMVYYPLPLQAQEAFRGIAKIGGGVKEETLEVSAELSASVLSLPMHTELTRAEQDRVIEKIREFFKL